jgi:hypothetical protein
MIKRRKIGDVDWINLILYRGNCKAVVNTVMNCPVPVDLPYNRQVRQIGLVEV